MDDLTIQATELTPSVITLSAQQSLQLAGESYAENSANFYAPVLKWIDEYLYQPDHETLTFNFNIIYLNSSTSKIFMDLFDNLDTAVMKGKTIVVNWHYDEDNDMSLMYGEEFKMDVKKIIFNLIEEKTP